jgi:hypothetical protein
MNDLQGYKLKGRSLEGALVGKPIINFSEELTKDAVLDISSRIIFMDALYQAVKTAISDGHIQSVLTNLEKLQYVYNQYKQHSFLCKRKNRNLIPKD